MVVWAVQDQRALGPPATFSLQSGVNMNSNRGVANLLSTPFFQILAQPWLDRTIAFIAMVPTLYLAYFRYQHMRVYPQNLVAFDF